MALWSYRIVDNEGNFTGEETEELFSYKNVPTEIISSDGRRAIKKGIEMIAKPPLALGGLGGYWDRNLQASYSSYAERDAICKARGLVPTDCIDKHWVDDKFEKDLSNNIADTRKQEVWEAACKKHDLDIGNAAGDDEGTIAQKTERVWEELIPFEAVKNGHTTKFQEMGGSTPG